MATALLGTQLSCLASAITMTTSITCTCQLTDTSLGFNIFFHVFLWEHHKGLSLLADHWREGRPLSNHFGLSLWVTVIHQNVDLCSHISLLVKKKVNTARKAAKKIYQMHLLNFVELKHPLCFNTRFLNYQNYYWNSIPSLLLITFSYNFYWNIFWITSNFLIITTS